MSTPPPSLASRIQSTAYRHIILPLSRRMQDEDGSDMHPVHDHEACTTPAVHDHETCITSDHHAWADQHTHSDDDTPYQHSTLLLANEFGARIFAMETQHDDSKNELRRHLALIQSSIDTMIHFETQLDSFRKSLENLARRVDRLELYNRMDATSTLDARRKPVVDAISTDTKESLMSIMTATPSASVPATQLLSPFAFSTSLFEESRDSGARGTGLANAVISSPISSPTDSVPIVGGSIPSPSETEDVPIPASVTTKTFMSNALTFFNHCHMNIFVDISLATAIQQLYKLFERDHQIPLFDVRLRPDDLNPWECAVRIGGSLMPNTRVFGADKVSVMSLAASYALSQLRYHPKYFRFFLIKVPSASCISNPVGELFKFFKSHASRCTPEFVVTPRAATSLTKRVTVNVTVGDYLLCANHTAINKYRARQEGARLSLLQLQTWLDDITLDQLVAARGSPASHNSVM